MFRVVGQRLAFGDFRGCVVWLRVLGLAQCWSVVPPQVGRIWVIGNTGFKHNFGKFLEPLLTLYPLSFNPKPLNLKPLNLNPTKQLERSLLDP